MSTQPETKDSTQHTPGPWKVVEVQPGTFEVRADSRAAFDDVGLMGDYRGCSVAEALYNAADPAGSAKAEANARRIVAAVNACAGIPTEALEQGIVGEALDLITRIYRRDPCWSFDELQGVVRKAGRAP